MEPQFPDIEVELVGQDGNAFAVMARVTTAMRKAHVSKADIDAYMADAMSGDYDHLLRVTCETVTVL